MKFRIVKRSLLFSKQYNSPREFNAKLFLSITVAAKGISVVITKSPDPISKLLQPMSENPVFLV